MYWPKQRVKGPDGFIDKFEAAELLKMNPESFMRGVRQGSVKLTAYAKAGDGARVRYWFDRKAVLAEKRRRQTLRA
jgi:hypothetical protein